MDYFVGVNSSPRVPSLLPVINVSALLAINKLHKFERFGNATNVLLSVVFAGGEAEPEDMQCQDLPASASFCGSLPPLPLLLLLKVIVNLAKK